MNTTKVYEKNLGHYIDNSPLIINQGGTSSSKTFSVLQLLFTIAFLSKKRLIISIVSYSLPHLKLGAMRDFESILIGEGYNIKEIKDHTNNFYRINNSIIEFFSADNLGKVHGPRRDLLYLNECNHLKYEIYNQLAIRTRGTIFLDFNPTRQFWVHDEVIPNEKHSFIKSTYLDNNFLDGNTIARIETRKKNINWWTVYGLGEVGKLEGAIIQNWVFGEFNELLPYSYGFDFGVRDPDALVKVAVDKKNKKIFWKEELYKNNLSTDNLVSELSHIDKNKMIIAESATPRTIKDLKSKGFNIRAVKKSKIVDDIKVLTSYDLIIDNNSYNLGKELNNWVWLDKKGNIPLDDYNHLIDAARYGTMIYLNSKKKNGQKML